RDEPDDYRGGEEEGERLLDPEPGNRARRNEGEHEDRGGQRDKEGDAPGEGIARGERPRTDHGRDGHRAEKDRDLVADVARGTEEAAQRVREPDRRREHEQEQEAALDGEEGKVSGERPGAGRGDPPEREQPDEEREDGPSEAHGDP